MRGIVRDLLEYALCIGLLIATASLVFYPAVERLVPTTVDGIFWLPPWEAARPSDLTEPTPLNTAAERYLPWRVFQHETMQHGGSLLWNPYEGCGQPHFALWETRCLSPFTIPFYLLPLGKAVLVSAWLKILACGLTAFFMGRRFSLPIGFALLCGLAFQLSGAALALHETPLTDVLPWTPLLFLSADRFSAGLNRSWPACALVLALMLFGGAPAAVVMIALFATVFIITRSILQNTPGSLPRNTAPMLGATAVAIGIAAIQVLPYLELLKQSVALSRPAVGPNPPWSGLVTAFLPEFFSIITQENGSVHMAVALYASLPLVLMLPVWVSLRQYPAQLRRTRVDAILMTGLLFLVLGLIGPPLSEGIPVLRHLRTIHWLLPLPLVIAYTAAEAADEWVALNAEAMQATLKRLVLALPVLILAAVVVAALSFHSDRADAPSFLWQVLRAGALLGGTLGLLAVTVLRPNPRLMAYGLCAIAAADLFLLFQPTISFTTPEKLFPKTSFIESLDAMDTRVSGTAALREWPLAANLLPQIYSASGVRLKRHSAFLSRVEERPLLLRRMGSQALLLTKEDIQGTFASVRSKLAVDHVFQAGAILFDDLGAKPRAWMAYEAREIAKMDPLLLDPDAAPLVEGVVPPPDSEGPTAEATITSESNAEVHIDVDPTRPGILVLADAWYPGWKAKVDGVNVPVFPVDIFARGVVVGEGNHEVVFYFRPLSVTVGGVITLTTLLFLIFSGVKNLLLARRNTTGY